MNAVHAHGVRPAVLCCAEAEDLCAGRLYRRTALYLVAAMWRNAPVVVLLALCWAAPAHPAQMGEEPDICAMTEVLVAMKKLLLLLSTEIRDLRQQVKTSCQAGDGVDTNDTSTATTDGLDGDGERRAATPLLAAAAAPAAACRCLLNEMTL